MTITLPHMTLEITDRVVVRANDDLFTRGLGGHRRTRSEVEISAADAHALLGGNAGSTEKYRARLRRTYRRLFCGRQRASLQRDSRRPARGAQRPRGRTPRSRRSSAGSRSRDDDGGGSEPPGPAAEDDPMQQPAWAAKLLPLLLKSAASAPRWVG
jgi:hypothetical protein